MPLPAQQDINPVGQDGLEVGKGLKPKRDSQTATADGSIVRVLIDGVVVRPTVTIPDERGTLAEMYNPMWGFHPIVYAYQFTIAPGMIKGWAVHHITDDLYFHSAGKVKTVLYDDRPQSPTYRMINEFIFSDYNRSILLIPRYIWHATQNLGVQEAVLTNFPSQVYDYANPDKYRLPLDTDQIPYQFERAPGW